MEETRPTNAELVEMMLKSRGLNKISGELNGIDPLLPLILLDIEYSIFKRRIKDVECTHKLQGHRSEWKRNYDIFDGTQFACFKEGSPYRDRIIELMDDLEEFITPAVDMLSGALDGFLPEFCEYDRAVLVDSIVCNTLIRIAASYWTSVYRTDRGNGEINIQIQAMAFHSKWFINIFLDTRKVNCGIKNLSTRQDILEATHNIEQLVDDWVYSHKDN